jgi:ADP-ribose pyrophosphatase YjhB (NUDIX family)
VKRQQIRQTIVARAVIIHRGKILLTRMKDRSWHFLPGGHVETGEFTENALRRELKEEFGLVVKQIQLLGVYDNHFDMRATERHNEIGLVFLVRTTGKVQALENHITFDWVEFSRLGRLRIFPPGIGQRVFRAVKTDKVFWMVRRDRGVK